jgi:hypothetical protein
VTRKNKGLMPLKGYYTRARVFAYLVLATGVAYLLYHLFQDIVE